jgi:serine/threonine-protein kinase
VFRAYDAERERLVAVKLFKVDLAPERVHQLVAAFEQLIAAGLAHPAIAAPIATGMAGVSAYLAQDYVAAESLDLAVRQYGPAPPADALRVAAQLASAIDFAAVIGTSHGALHPRDILLSADETRLTGLGIAQALEGIGAGAPVRRPYTAPERMAGAAWGRAADIFALAALAHELLWARRITGPGWRAADTVPELPGANTAALHDTFARALAQDPGERFETALQFAEALSAAFPDVAVAAPAQPAAPVDVSGTPQATTPSMPEVVVLRPEPQAREPRLPLDAFAEIEPVVERPEPHLSVAPIEDVEGPVEKEAVEIPPARGEAAPFIAEPPSISIVERSRSAVWPLVASMALGLAVGFAGGYGVGTRERSSAPTFVAADASPAPQPAAPPAASVAPPSATGRESTEVTVPVAPPPVADRLVAAPPRETSQGRATGTERQSAARTPPPTRPTPPKTTRPARPAAERTEALPPSDASGTAGRFAGRLSVESNPTGARVFLDNRLIGTTPLAVPSVPAGSHAIRLERDGYRRWSSSVRVVAAEQNRVTASLER